MSELFLTADLHLGHEKTCTVFQRADGTGPLRPFESGEEMDREIIQRWNRQVTSKDTTIILGDVSLRIEHLSKLNELNGSKILVGGNHDKQLAFTYLTFFDDVRGVYEKKGIVMTHVPVHPDSLGRWIGNAHGHTHDSSVMLGDYPDPRYLCMSLEQWDFEPAPWDVVRQRLKDGREYFNRFIGGQTPDHGESM